MKNDRYVAIEPLKNRFIKLDRLLASFSHIELREHMLPNILKNKIDDFEIRNIINFYFEYLRGKNKHNFSKILF